MSDQHTPEPWEYAERSGFDYGSKNYGVSAPSPFHWVIPPLNINPNDARRIVACVNACRKVETADLESLTELGGVVGLIVLAEDYRELLAGALTLLTPTSCATPEGWADRRRLAQELPQRIREAINL